MAGQTGNWRVQLGQTAASDYSTILEWTAEHFGAGQAERYANILMSAIGRLEYGPKARGAKAREDLGRGIFTLRVADRNRRARHVLVFRVASGDKRVLSILRILHDSMDFSRHLPGDDE